MAVDILAAVYEFVKAYAYNPEDANSKQLTADQIIRAGLNDAPVVSTSTELCIMVQTIINMSMTSRRKATKSGQVRCWSM